MKIPNNSLILQLLTLFNSIGLIFLFLSVSFHTSDIFCLHDSIEEVSKESISSYFYFIIIPLYLCVIFNLFLFFSLHYHLSISKQNNSADLSFLHQTNKLLQIIRRLLFYPLLFSICLLPEALLLLLNIFMKKVPIFLYYVSSVSMGLMGFAISINYFLRQSTRGGGNC